MDETIRAFEWTDSERGRMRQLRRITPDGEVPLGTPEVMSAVRPASPARMLDDDISAAFGGRCCRGCGD